MELAFITTEDLIQELTKRTTFVGLVIHSKDQHTKDTQEHNDFQVTTSLDNESLIHILATVIDDLQTNNFVEKNQ